MRSTRLLVFPRRLLFAVVAASIISGCSSSSDEEQIHALLAAAEAASEARNTSAVLDLVATDYTDAQGFDKAQLQDYLRLYFLTHPKIELLVHSGPVEFETANRARVHVEVVMIGTRRGAEPSSGALTGESESLQVELQRRDSKWRVTRADRIRK